MVNNYRDNYADSSIGIHPKMIKENILMNTAKVRIEALIEFAKQSALLKSSPPQNISQHNEFNRFEEKLQGLPGLSLNYQINEFDEVWLKLERLHESKPTPPDSKLLLEWIDLLNTPNKEPTLKLFADREKLLAIGAIKLPELSPDTKPEIALEENFNDILLESFESKELVKSQLRSYIEVVWKEWSEKEKEVRKSITLYSELFLLSQRLQGNLIDSQLELAWGIGIGVWNLKKGILTYPLLTQLVEISLDEESMAMEIRPRSTEPRLEVDLYATMNNPGVASLVSTAKTFFNTTENVLNPFEPSSFEGLLKSAATFLDGSGVYWPNKTTSDDRKLPKSSDNLVVTDTWVLFARPRSSSLFVQDLERFQKRLEVEEIIELPGAISALVTEPSTSNENICLPAYRGLSMVGGSYNDSTGLINELFFPKAYNDEQVQIIQMLKVHDGVVVQGPPGTGKTHTIANIICHYLALGKRVLVTSMKDPALAVLQEKLPDSIRPLAISLLTSEAEGMKQFEFAINKIASEVTRIDKSAYRLEIEEIDGRIESLHGLIAKTDKEISSWANLNLNKIVIDDDELAPMDAAKLVVTSRKETDWFPDRLLIDSRFKPLFGNKEISTLREIRYSIGGDLQYLGIRIPQISEFPETNRLIQVHKDLSRLSALKLEELKGLVPPLINSDSEFIKATISVASEISNQRLLLQELDNAQQTWIGGLQQYLRRSQKNEILDLFHTLKEEILITLHSRKQFLSRPVSIGENLDTNEEVVEAIQNLAKGKRAFGLSGLLGKNVQKKILDSILIVTTKPVSSSDWEHVLNLIQFQQKCRFLLVRWNTLSYEISLPTLESIPVSLVSAGLAIELYEKIIKSIEVEEEITRKLKLLLPSWEKVDDLPYSHEALQEAERILNHHLTRHRLAETWVVKESFLSALYGCGGTITDQLKNFLSERLGCENISDIEIQTEWSELMLELRRVNDLTSQLNNLTDITKLIDESGAPIWAENLRTKVRSGINDEILPDNWKEVWRICRLISFVNSIDGRKDLSRLSKLRSELESDLAKLYQEAVNKRTWLKLAENSTHDVRAALEAYRSAIRKIGKGKGVRAGRYRQDARFAAERANQAIPCWIMPHYRICESLPATFGSFDLVIIDEASQSDLTALPAILRGQKVLIVGDDKQVSPEGIGLEETKVRNLMTRFLLNQVDIYRPQMAPDRSIYDLFKVVFSKSAVMLHEHFRCVSPIIEYSKREFYNHELIPLRIPKVSERLDPPLVDVYVKDGYRNGKLNLPEARFIVDEIKCITENPELSNRTIGVVSLLGNEQAFIIMQMLNDEIGEKLVTAYKITCGDARTFQGKERDIMFLSMVASPGKVTAQSSDMFAQRFNVAASRARDRMYLVRSLQFEDLSSADILRAGLLQHFQAPFTQNEEEVGNYRELCESPFEREVFDFLVERGYRVIPQVEVGAYRIDMVVEGDNDNRLAIECDGDRYHGPDQWDKDMRRQRILERAGWKFWRCFASAFVLELQAVTQDLVETLNASEIYPTNNKTSVKSIHVELREIVVFQGADKSVQEDDSIEFNQEDLFGQLT